MDDEILDLESFKYNITQGNFINNDYESDGWKFILQNRGVCLYLLSEENEEQGFLSIRRSISVDEELNFKVVSDGVELKTKSEGRRLESYSQLKGLMQRMNNNDASLSLESNESTRLEKLEIEYMEEEHVNVCDETTLDEQPVVTCEYDDINNENDTEKFEYSKETITNPSKNYQCNICNKSFKKSSTLRDHQNIHTQQKPYSCSVCSRAFSFETSLISHIKLHNNIKEHKCSYCGKMFARRRNMQCHERLVHVKEKPFMCSTCGKTYTDSTCFKKHIANHQTPQQVKSANTTKAVQAQPRIPKTKIKKLISPSHEEAGAKKPRQRRNTGPKKHKCDLCDKMFARRRNVLHHMTYTHNNLKPHECQFCGKKYSDITSFKRHIRGHTDPAELSVPEMNTTHEYLIEEEGLDDFSTIELQSGLTDEAITFIVIAEN